MKLEKKHCIIIAIIAVILVWYFFLRKKKTESGYGFRESPTRRKPSGDPSSYNYDLLGRRSTQATAGVSVGVGNHPKCWPGTTWKNFCACCVPDNPSEQLIGNNKTFKNAVRNIG